MGTDDGGWAFPVPMIPSDNDGGYTEVRFGGMSLRDYFAAHAPPMDGEWASYRRGDEPDHIAAQNEPRLQAEWRFAFADAMLSARTEKATST